MVLQVLLHDVAAAAAAAGEQFAATRNAAYEQRRKALKHELENLRWASQQFKQKHVGPAEAAAALEKTLATNHGPFPCDEKEGCGDVHGCLCAYRMLDPVGLGPLDHGCETEALFVERFAHLVARDPACWDTAKQRWVKSLPPTPVETQTQTQAQTQTQTQTQTQAQTQTQTQQFTEQEKAAHAICSRGVKDVHATLEAEALVRSVHGEASAGEYDGDREQLELEQEELAEYLQARAAQRRPRRDEVWEGPNAIYDRIQEDRAQQQQDDLDATLDADADADGGQDTDMSIAY